ncbi:MAG: enoyl-CoA hydratase/isomerase family protein [Actinomycetota bacterium]
MSDLVACDITDGVAVVSYNRPEKHNAFSDALDDAFFSTLAELHDRDDVRAMVWRGEGKSFSSGRDTSELGLRAPGVTDLDYIARGHARTKLLWTSPFPIVVALKGWVIGGSFERALLCDIRIAAEDARMSLPEVAHGVIPDSGGVARLFQMAGHGLAADLALTGRVMDAHEALSHGVVSRVVPLDELDDAALEIARGLAERSPLAVRLTREVLRNLATPEVERSMHQEWISQSVVMGERRKSDE